MTVEAAVTEEKPQQNKWRRQFIIVFIIVLINLVIEILVSVLAVILVSDYFSQLIALGGITFLLFTVEGVVCLIIAFLYAEIGKRIFKWSEDRKTDHLMYSFVLLFVILLVIISVLLYLISGTSFPLILDPFDLGSTSALQAVLFSLWWFFGFIIFIISAIVVTIFFLYIMVES